MTDWGGGIPVNAESVVLMSVILLYFYFALHMPELFSNVLIVLLSSDCNEALDYFLSTLFEVNEIVNIVN